MTLIPNSGNLKKNIEKIKYTNIMKTLKNKSMILEYPNHKSIEPENLVSFTQKYLDSIPKLIRNLEKNTGKNIELLFVRMKPDGSIQERKMTGSIKEVTRNNFIFLTNQDLDGSFYEETRELFVRTDNVLGLVPLSPDNKINPFNELPLEAKDYLCWLEKVKKLMRSYIGRKHKITFYWKYSKKKLNFRKGNYQIDGKIIKVNKSNVKYWHYRTISFIQNEKEKDYINLIPHEEVDRFIALDRILIKIDGTLDVEHEFNFYDNE